LKEINKDLVERMTIIFEAVTRYVIKFLINLFVICVIFIYRYAFICLSYLDQNVVMPEDSVNATFLLLPGTNGHIKVKDSYCLALYNDEVHTYEAVSTAIIRSVSCSSNVAMDYTLKVDNLGRALIKFGNYAVMHLFLIF